jgi:hypothetical protein
MSAFQVSNRHIDLLVYARTLPDFKVLESDLDRDELGRLLLGENLKSLAARYGDDRNAGSAASKSKWEDVKQVEAYVYSTPTDAAGVRDIVSIIKQIHCYEYQSCEHEGWETSRASKYCKDLLELLLFKLPGYAAAKWGV